jgi:hypothetical protein
MQYVLLVAVAVLAVYFIFAKVLAPLYDSAVAFLGRAIETVAVFFQWTVWNTEIGNIVLSLSALMLLSVIMYKIYRALEGRLGTGRFYDQAAIERVLSYAISNYKLGAAAPLTERVKARWPRVVLRIALLATTAGSLAYILSRHIRGGTILNLATLTVLGLGTAMILFLGISFTIAAGRACPKGRDGKDA